jgi:hypothetical protein
MKSFEMPQFFESNSKIKDNNNNLEKNIISNPFDFNILSDVNTGSTNNIEIKNDFFTLFDAPNNATATVSGSNKISSTHNFNFDLDDISSQNTVVNENNQYKNFNFF